MKRAVGIGDVLRLSELSAVGIAENNIHCDVGERRILRRRLVAPAGDSLIEHNLTGSVDAAITCGAGLPAHVTAINESALQSSQLTVAVADTQRKLNVLAV